MNNLLSNGADLIQRTTSSLPRDLVVSTANETSAQTMSLMKKVVGFSLASVAVVGSAFYVGYQLAKKRHRFHVRETDKNDQVTLSI